MRLNGNGYFKRSGSPTGTVHTLKVIGILNGAGVSPYGGFGGFARDKIQVILPY